MNKLFYKKEKLPLWWYFHHLCMAIIVLGLIGNFFSFIQPMKYSLFKLEATICFGLAFITVVFMISDYVRISYNHCVLKQELVME